MTQPTAYPGRPVTPAAGGDGRELRVAQLRSHARRLLWSALILIGVAGAAGYFAGNLPAPFEDWMLWAAAGGVVVVFVVAPYLRWLTHTYTITTRRVIERSGVFGQRRSELSHSRGYTISERRGPLQRLWGAGTLTLTGADYTLRLANIPSARLVHETLVDQVEMSQILAHRDAPSFTGMLGGPPPLP